ncbi:hypothetical protein Hamer_G006419 [Homarus americanus]|uniref:Uncharacterized protein n=1 Tax=Homarus americanus TaxID=6706 RepID=A0A8J5JTN5_HOMAM|nr:hypothetical protein Hamer_G006419 [Homarus americanus]
MNTMGGTESLLCCCSSKGRCFLSLQSKINSGYAGGSSQFVVLSLCVTNHYKFQRVNFLFQTIDADPEELVSELVLYHKVLQYRILDGNGKPLPLNMVDYGAKFMHELYTFINQQNRSAEAVSKVDEVKERCAGLLIEALKQVEGRLPAFARLNVCHSKTFHCSTFEVKKKRYQ